MRFDIFTLFPAMFDGPFSDSILKRAQDAGLLEIHTHNIRDYAESKHKITDDMAYGGGGGMVMKPEPIFRAVEAILGSKIENEELRIEKDEPSQFSILNSQFPVILMSAGGRTFTHEIAAELSKHARVALVCGHYEGVDERVREHLCTDEISVGNYVLTGGELPAMVIIDTVARLIPGVLPPGVPEEESHASGMLEYPHYTRPADFRGWKVPEVLLSGNHAEIEKWRRQQSEARTQQRRTGNQQASATNKTKAS